MTCKHKFEVDELFEDGIAIMIFGDINNLKPEKGYVCKLCGDVKYE